jgi:hypothetical protein
LPKALQTRCHLVEKRVKALIITLLGETFVGHACLFQVVDLSPQKSEALPASPAPARLAYRLQHSPGIQ